MHLDNKNIFYITETADFLKMVGMTEKEFDLFIRDCVSRCNERPEIKDKNRRKLKYYYINHFDYKKANDTQRSMISKSIRTIIRWLRRNELLVVVLFYGDITEDICINAEEFDKWFINFNRRIPYRLKSTCHDNIRGIAYSFIASNPDISLE